MRVAVFGTFDLLHPGHSFVLREAERRGDVTVVVARDATVQRIKGRLPVQSEEERIRAISETFPRMEVVLGDGTDFLLPIRTIQPDLILLGYDQRLPPGVGEADLQAPVERLPAFEPNRYKSSIRRNEQ